MLSAPLCTNNACSHLEAVMKQLESFFDPMPGCNGKMGTGMAPVFPTAESANGPT